MSQSQSEHIVQCLNLKFKRIYTVEEINKHLDTLAAKIDESFKKIQAQEP